MRASILTALAAALLFAGPAKQCFAQAAGPEKAAAPQALTGEGGADRQKLIKTAPAASTKEGTGRVGTLSPDEQRRAARLRARATSAEKTPPARLDGRNIDDETSASKRSAERDRFQPAARTAVTAMRRPTREKISTVGPLSPDPVSRSPRRRTAVRRPLRFASMRAHAVSRRLASADLRRVPRVGDFVPADVPLSSLPPNRPFPYAAQPVFPYAQSGYPYPRYGYGYGYQPHPFFIP